MTGKNYTTLVSVLIITYNHENYIRQAIDGALMQKCEFNFHIVIADDLSTDNTRIICKEYADKYPQKIELIERNKNLGLIQNYSDLLSKAKGKYIAQCSGDDYWIDEYKLHKQISFLENHPRFSLCFHNIKQKFIGDETEISLLTPYKSGVFLYSDIWNDWMIQASTIVFHTDIVKSSYYLKYSTHKAMYYEDVFLLLCSAEKGQLYGLEESMSVYRKHPGSITANGSSPKTSDMNKMLSYISLIGSLFNNKYKQQSQNYYTFKALRYAYVCKERKLYFKTIHFLFKAFLKQPKKFLELVKAEYTTKKD